MNNQRTNSFKSQRQKSKGISLPLFIRKSGIYQFLTKLKRGQKTNLRLDLKGLQPLKLKRIPTLLILGFFLFFGGFHVVKYFSFIPESYDGSEIKSSLGRNSSILIVGFNDRVEGYRFPEYISVVNINNSANLTRIYGINPSFSIRQINTQLALKNLWNNLDSEEKMPEFISRLESFLGLKLDGYIVFDRSIALEFLSNENFSMQTSLEYSNEGKTIQKNQLLNASEIFNFMFDINVANNDLVKFQNEFTKAFLDSFKNPFKIYNTIFNSSEFLKTYKTNFDRGTLIKLISFFNQAQIIVPEKGFLSTDLGTKDNDRDLYVPNMTIMDDSIRSFFSDFEVVKEQAKVEVFNATNTAGIANRYRRMIQNKGGNVINVNNFPELIDEIKIYLDLGNYDSLSNTIDLISSSMGVDVTILSIDEYKYNYSGDIILVIGSDILLE